MSLHVDHKMGECVPERGHPRKYGIPALNGAIRRDRNAGHHGRGPVSVGGSAWTFDCHLSRPEARRDLRGGSLEGYAPVPTLAAGDIVVTRGGRSTLTGQPTMPPTRGLALSCCTACLIFGQAAPQKQLTARELFYAAAQAPASQTDRQSVV